jgi:hypothetical protein
MILSPREYSDRVYAEAGGAANALDTNSGTGRWQPSWISLMSRSTADAW